MSYEVGCPVRGYLAHQKTPTPWDYRKTLGIGLLLDPGRRRFFMGEVLL